MSYCIGRASQTTWNRSGHSRRPCSFPNFTTKFDTMAGVPWKSAAAEAPFRSWSVRHLYHKWVLTSRWWTFLQYSFILPRWWIPSISAHRANLVFLGYTVLGPLCDLSFSCFAAFGLLTFSLAFSIYVGHRSLSFFSHIIFCQMWSQSDARCINELQIVPSPIL